MFTLAATDAPHARLDADGILDAMDVTSRVLVVLGLFAGAMVAAVTVAALSMLAGVDTHGIASQLLMSVAGAGGAVVGARVNLVSGRTLVAERAANRAEPA
jgi:hypothetical protein